MRHDADEATGREHGADRDRAPLRLCEQEDVHIRAGAATHIGEEEIDSVQSIQPHAKDQFVSLQRMQSSAEHRSRQEILAIGDAAPVAALDAGAALCERSKLDCGGEIVVVAGSGQITPTSLGHVCCWRKCEATDCPRLR